MKEKYTIASFGFKMTAVSLGAITSLILIVEKIGQRNFPIGMGILGIGTLSIAIYLLLSYFAPYRENFRGNRTVEFILSFMGIFAAVFSVQTLAANMGIRDILRDMRELMISSALLSISVCVLTFTTIFIFQALSRTRQI